MRRCLARTIVVAAILPLCGSCAGDPPTPAPAGAGAVDAPSSLTHPAALRDHSALHNLQRVNDRILSGAVPDGDAAFDELKALGVRTVISVDGATPDVGRAKARGLRYVHIPTTYATVTEAQQRELARAIRDLPGPVYIHCHHGKHRGPAAAASAAVALGILSPDEGVAFMKSAGTAPNYTGLYACVAAASALSVAVIDAAPAEFPEVRRADGIVAAMIEVDLAYEHLAAIRAAGWAVPTDHPDLVPAAEAGRLADNLRLSAENPTSTAHGEAYMALLHEAVRHATDLEDALALGSHPPDELERRFKLVQASCKSCHADYRDVP